MIGALRGTILERSSEGEVLLDVHGVCYRVHVTPATLASIVETNVPVLVHTHLHVRETELTLFGFGSRDERTCFEALIGAHGIGPAMAMSILAVHRPEALREIVLVGRDFAGVDHDRGATDLEDAVATHRLAGDRSAIAMALSAMAGAAAVTVSVTSTVTETPRYNIH
jgi:Holliday junction DNA helicase RuvA